MDADDSRKTEYTAELRERARRGAPAQRRAVAVRAGLVRWLQAAAWSARATRLLAGVVAMVTALLLAQRAVAACGAAPKSGCETGDSSLQIRTGGLPAKNSFKLQFKNVAMSDADLGDPTITGGIEVCVYDGDGLKVDLTPAPAEWGYWSRRGTGRFSYKDARGEFDGIGKIDLSGRGTLPMGKIVVQAKGAALPVDGKLPLLRDGVTAQVVSSTGGCWSAHYLGVEVGANDSTHFVGKEKTKTTPGGCTGAACGPCGNGRIDTGEECDDGNIRNGDGCSAICKTEAMDCPGKESPSGNNTWGYEPLTNGAVALGAGFDPKSPDRLFANCFKPSPVVRMGDGARGRLVKRFVTSRDELYDMLERDASLRVHAFKFDSSFKIDSSIAHSFDSDSLTFAVNLSIDLGRYRMKDLELEDWAAQLLAEGRVEDFTRSCGSKFVNSVDRGVSVTLLFTYSNLSRSEQNALRAQFNATYGAPGVDVEARGNLESTIRSMSSRVATSVEVVSEGAPSAILDLFAQIEAAPPQDDGVSPYVEAIANFLRAHKIPVDDYGDCAAGETCPALPVADGEGDPTLAGAALGYSSGDMSAFMAQYGVSGCFLQGIDVRDRRLADLYLELEEKTLTRRRLANLRVEVARDLIPELGIDTDYIDLIDYRYQLWIDAVREAGRACLADFADTDANGLPRVPYSNCLTTDKIDTLIAAADRDFFAPKIVSGQVVGILPPALPEDVVEALYGAANWTFRRWCVGFVQQDPIAAPGTEAGNTVAAIMSTIGRDADGTLGEGDCETVASELQYGKATLSLEGYPSYDARVLRQVKGLTLLQITGDGGPLKNPEALQIHSGLRELRLDGLGIDDDELGHLLYTASGAFPWPSLQSLRLANNEISFSFPHELSTWVWPTSLTVDLANNPAKCNRIENNACTECTFAPSPPDHQLVLSIGQTFGGWCERMPVGRSVNASAVGYVSPENPRWTGADGQGWWGIVGFEVQGGDTTNRYVQGNFPIMTALWWIDIHGGAVVGPDGVIAFNVGNGQSVWGWPATVAQMAFSGEWEVRIAAD